MSSIDGSCCRTVEDVQQIGLIMSRCLNVLSCYHVTDEVASECIFANSASIHTSFSWTSGKFLAYWNFEL